MVSGEEKQRRGCSLSGVAKDQEQTHPNSSLPFPKSDARPFQDITTPQRDQLLADITAAAIARERAVTGGTHDSEARAWRRWTEYCDSVGCKDLFMD